MAPPLGRAAFTTGLTVFLLALLVLPSLDSNSPEFVADVLALLISGVFLAVVIISVRRAARLPQVWITSEDRSKETGPESETNEPEQGQP